MTKKEYIYPRTELSVLKTSYMTMDVFSGTGGGSSTDPNAPEP